MRIATLVFLLAAAAAGFARRWNWFIGFAILTVFFGFFALVARF